AFYAFIMHALAFNTLLSSQETDAYTIVPDRLGRSSPPGLEAVFFSLALILCVSRSASNPPDSHLISQTPLGRQGNTSTFVAVLGCPEDLRAS
ncbi:hypothetical protein, partial [Spongiactinospora sp. TRM90649]|uniref:hypothetical protein n=1 Tax=Spongiactinospora sp. TRM90649 TaxID=3031114 RepID=UPI0023F859D2